MVRVRADPITSALAHPTRRSLYIALAQHDEMSTVHSGTSKNGTISSSFEKQAAPSTG